MRMDCFIITNAFLFDFLMDVEDVVLDIIGGIEKDV